MSSADPAPLFRAALQQQHWQHTFMFKHHIKVNFASNDPFNKLLHAGLISYASGASFIKCAYAQIWSWSVHTLKSKPVLILVKTVFDMEKCDIKCDINDIN